MYSHRYLLSGRILDADGDPVVGVPIPYGFTGFSGNDLCDGVPQRGVTDAYGDFSYCFHLHDLDPGDQISFRVKAAEIRRDVNLLTRWTHENVKTKNATMGAEPPADFHRAYALSGKVWQQTQAGDLDGVHVKGVAVAGVNVSVRATDEPSNETVLGNATTDEYGEYAVKLRFAKDVTYGHVTITAMNRSLELPLDAFFMSYRQDLRLPGNETHDAVVPGPPPAPTGGRELPRTLDELATFPDNPTEVRPGTGMPALSGRSLAIGLVGVTLGALGLAGWSLARRRRDP